MPGTRRARRPRRTCAMAQRLRWRGVARRREGQAPEHAGSAALVASEREACGAWQNKPQRRAHRVGRVYGCAPDVAGTSGPRVCTTSRRWTWCADRVLTRRERGPGARGRGVCAAKGTAARWQAWQRRRGGGGYNDVERRGGGRSGAVRRPWRRDDNDDEAGLLSAGRAAMSWLRG